MNIETLADGGITIVDLSLTLAPELPGAWPGALPFRHFVEHWFGAEADDTSVRLCGNDAPYRSHGWIIDEHTGTHFDAPSHFLPPPDSGLENAHSNGAITGDRVPPAQFMGPARVVDVTGLIDSAPDGISPAITADHVLEWEAQHVRIRPGDIVLFRSGWDARYVAGNGGDAFIRGPLERGVGTAWPAPQPETLELLADRGVRCVGTDGASMGPAENGAMTHIAGLRRGMVFIECLAALHQLEPTGAYFIFLPVKVARSAGGPGRAIAMI